MCTWRRTLWAVPFTSKLCQCIGLFKTWAYVCKGEVFPKYPLPTHPYNHTNTYPTYTSLKFRWMPEGTQEGSKIPLQPFSSLPHNMCINARTCTHTHTHTLPQMDILWAQGNSPSSADEEQLPPMPLPSMSLTLLQVLNKSPAGPFCYILNIVNI